jgi:hypothetical protein
MSTYGVPVAQDTARQAPTAPPTPTRALLPLLLPALVVGVPASLLFIGVSTAGEKLQGVLLADLPGALGVGRLRLGEDGTAVR